MPVAPGEPALGAVMPTFLYFLVPGLTIVASGLVRLTLFLAAAAAERWWRIPHKHVVELLHATAAGMPSMRRPGRLSRDTSPPP